MGLYDNYKLSFSQGVVPFAGSVVPELRAVKQEMDAGARKTLETADAMETMLSTTPVNDFDKPEQEKLIAETKEHLDKIKSGNLAFAQDYTRKLASQVTARLNGLAVRNKQMEGYKEELKKNYNLSPLEQEYKLKEVERANPPASIDENGQVAPLALPSVAKKVDNTEMVQKAAISVVRAKGYTVGKESMPIDNGNGTYSISTQEGRKEITGAELQEALNRALDADIDWQQSLEQEARARGYADLKNISDEELDNVVSSDETFMGQKARTLMAQNPGISSRDALEIVKAEEYRVNKEKQLRDYAGLAATEETTNVTNYNQLSSTKKQGEDGDESSLSDESSYLLFGNATAPTSTAQQTGKEISTSLTKYQTDITTLEAQIQQFEGQAAKLGSGPDYNNAMSQVENLKNQKAVLETQKAVAVSAQQRILDQAAREVTRQKDGTSQSWAETKTAEIPKLAEKLVAQKGMSEKEAADVATAFVNKQYKVVNGKILSTGLPEKLYNINGKPYPMSLGYFVFNNMPTVAAIQAKAEYVKDNPPNMLAGGINIIPKFKESLKAALPVGAYYDMANKPISNEELQKINFQKAEPVAYLKRLDRIQVVTEDGKVYLMDAANTDIRSKIARDLAHNKKIKNPTYIQEGINLELNNAPVYEKAYGAGTGIVTGHPTSGLKDPKDPTKGYKDPIIIGGKEYGIQRTPKNDFMFVNLTTNKSEELPYNSKGDKKRNFSFNEIETILNRMLQ